MAFSLASFIASILTSWQVSVVKYFEQFQSFQTYVILVSWFSGQSFRLSLHCGQSNNLTQFVLRSNTSFFHSLAISFKWLALASVADILITGALVHTLSKSKTGFQATDQLVHKLVRSTIQTNALTTIFQVTDLVLFVSSNSTLHLIFNFPLGKLYINSLFSTLNARAYMRGWGSSASNGYSGSTDGIIDGTKQSSKSRNSQKIRPGRVSIGGNPISSRNARSPTSSSFVLSPVRKGFTPTQSQIQVTTIEERFEGQVDRDLELALQEEERAHQLTSPPVTPGFKKESNEGASKRYFLDAPTDNNIAGAFGISPASNENSVTSHHHRSFDSHSHFDSDADFKA